MLIPRRKKNLLFFCPAAIRDTLLSRRTHPDPENRPGGISSAGRSSFCSAASASGTFQARMALVFRSF
jgi:hypothetical protein